MTVDFSKLRKMLHRKVPEFLAPNAFGNTTNGGFLCGDKGDQLAGHNELFYVASPTSVWRYSTDEDAWMQMPSPAITGTFGSGSCGEFRLLSAPAGNQTNTATAGTITTFNTALTIVESLKGRRVRVVGGAGIGYDGTVAHNTLGANSIVTVETASGVAFGATTQFQLYAGSLWFFNAGAGTVGFAVYDIATGVWTNRVVTGLPTTFGTYGQLLATGGAISNGGLGFVNGTASAGGVSTLTADASKNWPLNAWANYQVRIKAGTGAGQIRTIASNTAGASGVLTVSVAWTVQPDATSVYVIEGNDDFLYLAGNNAVTLYRYSISANTWATLAPVADRGAAMGAGGMIDWIDNVAEWLEAAAGVYGNHYLTTIIRQNGRYFYSFRGAGNAILDVYDIAANTWVSDVVYSNRQETFNAGSHSTDMDGLILIQKEATGRFFKFNVAQNRMLPLWVTPMPQGAAVAGDKIAVQTFKEGTSAGRYLYCLSHTRTEMIRVLLV